MSDLEDRLREVVGPQHVLVDADLRAPYEIDWTRRFTGEARCVVRPASTAEVAAVVRACAEAGVPVTVVPGVTSAFAAPAVADVPVSHRGVAHEIVVVSGHVPPGDPRSLVDWPALGRLRGTVVLLMAVERIAAFAAALIEGGRSPETPVAVVQDGTMRIQRSARATLATVADVVRAQEIAPPAVIVVGAVAGLAVDPVDRIADPPAG